jgi:pentatricopeptide repeat protein
VDVAEEVARSLAVELLPGWKGAQRAAYRPSPEAHEHVLRGRYYWNKRSEAGFRTAIEEFNRAIEIDPNYAAAYVGLADSYGLMAVYAMTPPRDSWPRAKAAAEKALALDESSGAARVSLAAILDNFDWKTEEAERVYRKAIEIDPNYATAWQWYGDHLSRMKRFEEAREKLDEAVKLDPLSLVIMTDRGRVEYLDHKYERAIKHYESVLRMDPGFVRAHWDLGQALLMSGRVEEAVAELQIISDASGGKALYQGSLIYALAKAGQVERARKLLAELEEERERSYVSAFHIGMAYVGLGEIDEAMAWMERAYEARELYPYHATDPMLDPLLADARYEALLRRVGLKP